MARHAALWSGGKIYHGRRRLQGKIPEICGNFTESGGKSAVLLDAHGAETDIRYPRTTE